MTPVLLLILSLIADNGDAIMETQQIQFRTMEACQAAAEKLERDLAHLNAVALCVERVP